MVFLSVAQKSTMLASYDHFHTVILTVHRLISSPSSGVQLEFYEQVIMMT